MVVLYEQICNDNFDDKSIFKIQENEKLLNKYKAFYLFLNKENVNKRTLTRSKKYF